MKKSPADDVMRADCQSETRHRPGASVLYATTSAPVPDLAALRSSLANKKGPLARAHFAFKAALQP
jgi:hypothetical protein